MIELAGLDLAAFVAAHHLKFPPPPEPERRGRSRKRGDPTRADLDDLKWKLKCARSYIETIPPSVQGEKGSNAAYNVAITLVHGYALSVDEARPLFEEWNANCVPPWNAHEIDHKLADAEANGGDGERGHLIPRRPRPAAVGFPAVLPKFDVTGLDGDAPPPVPDAAAGDDPPSVAGLDDPKEGMAPVVDPFEAPTPDAEKETFANFTGEGDDRKPNLTQLLDVTRLSIFGGWPKRVGGELFVQGKGFRPVFVRRPEELFGWFDRRAWVRWTAGEDYVSMSRYFNYLRVTAEDYEGLQLLPHWPPVPGNYYMHPPVPVGTYSGKLEELVDMFSPYSATDRELIKALVCTLFWGGPPGKRPAFLITAGEDDTGGGRGVGKSTLVSILTECLVGGCIEVQPSEDIAAVKTRLFSDQGCRHRAARLDNVKTYRFSCADLESLLTASVISGKKLYVGEGRVANLVTWFMTLNGASLSKDMAQRTVVVMLRRPAYDPGWETRVRAFIRDNFLLILGDIANTLLSPPPDAFAVPSRWPEWEQGVLSKLNDPEACQEVVLARQKAIDADDDESREAREFILGKIRDSRNGDPRTSCVRVSTPTLAGWLSEVKGERCAVNRVAAILRTLRIKELSYRHTKDHRYWVWTGPDCLPGAQPRDGQSL